MSDDDDADYFGRTGEKLECYSCEGRGTYWNETCFVCAGYGWIREDEEPTP